MSLQAALDQLLPQVGQEVFVSDWLTVEQSQIQTFADATGDQQWIHTDVDRATSDSPYGSTIAHGYLTLSLYPTLRNMVDNDRLLYAGVKNVINYGLNKVRFPAAVRSGARIRARVTLAGVDEVKGGMQVTEVYTAEIEGEEKPACVAEAMMRFYF